MVMMDILASEFYKTGAPKLMILNQQLKPMGKLNIYLLQVSKDTEKANNYKEVNF